METDRGADPSGICSEIRRARSAGKTRCGVVDGAMGVADTARAFGLADDAAIYTSIDRAEADRIAIHLLHVDLAYGCVIMDVPRAGDLWDRFMALFQGEDARFWTNARSFGATTMSFSPATEATFDMGILVLSATRAGCLWVEDED